MSGSQRGGLSVPEETQSIAPGGCGGAGMTEKLCMRRVLIVLLVAAALGLGACASKQPKPGPSNGPETANAGAEGAGANNANAGAGANPDAEAAGPQGGLLVKRIVYFDFDSSEIKGEGTDVVAAHA